MVTQVTAAGIKHVLCDATGRWLLEVCASFPLDCAPTPFLCWLCFVSFCYHTSQTRIQLNTTICWVLLVNHCLGDFQHRLLLPSTSLCYWFPQGWHNRHMWTEQSQGQGPRVGASTHHGWHYDRPLASYPTWQPPRTMLSHQHSITLMETNQPLEPSYSESGFGRDQSYSSTGLPFPPIMP